MINLKTTTKFYNIDDANVTEELWQSKTRPKMYEIKVTSGHKI